jgi:hypothetical protein
MDRTAHNWYNYKHQILQDIINRYHLDSLRLKCRNIDEIQKAREDTRENFESIKEIQDLLSNSAGISADFNEVCYLHFLFRIG